MKTKSKLLHFHHPIAFARHFCSLIALVRYYI